MYNKADVIVFRTNVESSTTKKEYTQNDNIIDIEEFHKALLDSSKFVVLVNNISQWRDDINELMYIQTAKLKPSASDINDGWVDKFVLSTYTRTTSAAFSRKIIFAFNALGSETPKLTAQSFTS